MIHLLLYLNEIFLLVSSRLSVWCCYWWCFCWFFLCVCVCRLKTANGYFRTFYALVLLSRILSLHLEHCHHKVLLLLLNTRPKFQRIALLSHNKQEKETFHVFRKCVFSFLILVFFLLLLLLLLLLSFILNWCHFFTLIEKSKHIQELKSVFIKKKTFVFSGWQNLRICGSHT